MFALGEESYLFVIHLLAFDLIDFDIDLILFLFPFDGYTSLSMNFLNEVIVG